MRVEYDFSQTKHKYTPVVAFAKSENLKALAGYDKAVLFFNRSNESLHKYELHRSLGLDEPVDSMCWNKEGLLLFIALSSGVLGECRESTGYDK